MRRLINWIMTRWQMRKWDKLSKLVEADKAKRVNKILKEVLRESHKRLDAAFVEWATEENLDRIANSKDREEIRSIINEFGKKCKILVRLPLLSNLEDVKIKVPLSDKGQQ